MADLVKGKMDTESLTAKYLKEHGDYITRLNDNAVKTINDQLYNGKEVKLFQKQFDEKLLREKNIG